MSCRKERYNNASVRRRHTVVPAVSNPAWAGLTRNPEGNGTLRDKRCLAAVSRRRHDLSADTEVNLLLGPGPRLSSATAVTSNAAESLMPSGAKGGVAQALTHPESRRVRVGGQRLRAVTAPVFELLANLESGDDPNASVENASAKRRSRSAEGRLPTLRRIPE